MRFIGDVHGKFRRYRDIIRDCEHSIQVGDMGIGFRDLNGEPLANLPFESMSKGNHRFIRGNHDNPQECRNHPYWIKDGAIEDDMMLVGGAFSVDWKFRTEGLSWWSDEELSRTELLNLYDLYRSVEPRIMVTHTAPLFVPEQMGIKIWSGQENRTEKALEAMWREHKPEIWIFGHWHKSFDRVIMGTRFICLAELEWIDLD